MYSTHRSYHREYVFERFSSLQRRLTQTRYICSIEQFKYYCIILSKQTAVLCSSYTILFCNNSCTLLFDMKHWHFFILCIEYCIYIVQHATYVIVLPTMSRSLSLVARQTRQQIKNSFKNYFFTYSHIY